MVAPAVLSELSPVSEPGDDGMSHALAVIEPEGGVRVAFRCGCQVFELPTVLREVIVCPKHHHWRVAADLVRYILA